MSEQLTQASGLIEIAVLDDDLDFRNYIEDFLRDEGQYAVRTFAHPEDLFAAAEQRIPDVVLVDMKMGEFTGDKVVEQLLTRWPDLCIIIVTGYPSLEDMRLRLSCVFSITWQSRSRSRNSVRHCTMP